jgi:hypothetical protein
MCKLPVMFGGGMTIDQGGLPLFGFASNTPADSHRSYQRAWAVLKSNALSISLVMPLVPNV